MMKHSIAFIFTFFILAFGAVFSAPHCKASDTFRPNYVSEYRDYWTVEKLNEFHTLCVEDARTRYNITADLPYIYVIVDDGELGTYFTAILCDTPLPDLFIRSNVLSGLPDSNNNPFSSTTVYSCNVEFNRFSQHYYFNMAWVPYIHDYQSLSSFVCKALVCNYQLLNFSPETSFLCLPVSDPWTIPDYSPTNFRALFQGSFDITYIDDDTGTVFPVQLYSSWYKKNGVETEILRLGIVDSNSVGWSYNGHFHFTSRTGSFTAFRWLIGSVDYDTLPDFELPTVNNSQNLLTYNFDLTGTSDTVIHYALPSSNRFNIDIGNGDIRYKGYKDTILSSQFDSEFTSPELCSNFSVNFIDYYPYNTRVSTYILDGDLHGEGVKTALENTKLDDDTKSYSPVTFTGDTVPVDFPDFNLDNFDFSGINSLFGALFDNWYVLVLMACISIGIVGYVLFGKN